ncbi:MAG: PQQ-dependent sugar dehydrogenase, partial [Verrucomicrobia subdivision 3 bacterium]|nr:PQQ-dependent sugar dehydrogenase [Limisphaerales bacterium]
MKFPLRFAGLFLLTVTPLLGQPFGLTNRVANTTLRMPGSLPVTGYGVSNAFPGVIFQQPIAFASPPGETNRLFILEREGRVTVITNIASPNRTVFMDISGPVTTDGEEGLLGIAFHPNYAANRYFYLFYSLVTTTDAGPTRHQRISRFQTSASNPNQGVVASELPLITQRDEFSNHNGGDIHFGPDGYLYISLGDEGGQNDAGDNSQRIDKDFFAGIIRIDVDKLPANLPPNPHPARMGQTNYFVPADNPFVGATQFNGRAITNVLRTEWWAVGLRNPWRISFDPLTGALYAGDVGGSQREEVNLITRGGNYGWVYREGLSNTTIKTINAPPGFTSLPPIHEYTRGTAQNQGNSITGGVIYRGTRIPSLTGKYIFCDYGSGNIWALTPNGTNYVTSQFLADDPNIVAFGIDPSNGDVLMADIADPAVPIKRLAPAIISGSPPPATLADTGAFSDMPNLTPHAGIIPYDVNVPVWHDGAIMTRWFCISNVASRIQFRSTSPWTFPASTVWIQHLELELTNGVPASRRRVETRFLVRESTGAGVYGVTYRWGNSTTNATLVPDAGMDEEFVINDSGIVRTQVWHYPTRNECVTCHATPAGRALGFNTAQLNRDFNYNGVVDNQIRS